MTNIAVPFGERLAERRPLQMVLVRPHTILAVQLLLIVGAELLLVADRPLAAAQVYILFTLLLLLYQALVPADAERTLALALLLVPLIRLVALAVPLTSVPPWLWPTVVAIPIVPALWLASRKVASTAVADSRNGRELRTQLLLAACGPSLGLAAYALLPSAQAADSPAPAAFWAIVPATLFCTGVINELIFRGVLQSTLVRAVGRWGLLWGALLFAALQASQGTAVQWLFACGVGLLFAVVAYQSNSLLGVALAHGSSNLTLLVVLPYVSGLGNAFALYATLFLAWLGAAIFLAAWLSLNLSAHSALRRSVNVAGPRLRRLRRAARLTYCDLAQRTGISARLLAEFEHGVRHPKPEQERLIVQCLGGASL